MAVQLPPRAASLPPTSIGSTSGKKRARDDSDEPQSLVPAPLPPPIKRRRLTGPATANALAAPVVSPKHAAPLSSAAPAPGPAPVSASQPPLPMQKQVRALLNELARPHGAFEAGVRIAFDEEAPGFGHQAAGVQAYRKLRALGYEGPVEMVCFDEECHDKVQKLIAEYTDPTLTLKMIDDEVQPVRLTLMGADDADPELKTERDNDLPSEMRITLQPFQWSDERFVSIGGRQEELLVEHEYASFQPEPASYNDFGAWLGKQFELAPIPHAQPVQRALVDMKKAQQDGRLATCMVYGAYTDEAMPQLVDALTKAAAASAGPLQRILVVDLNREKNLDHDAVTFENSHYIDRDIKEFLNRPPGVAVWHLGNMPREVFQEVFGQSKLPPVCEGANTAELMTLSQRPFLRLAEPEEILALHSILTSPAKPDPAMDMAAAASMALMGDGPLDDIAKFLEQSLDPQSVVAKSFAERGSGAKHYTSNQVFMALHQLAAMRDKLARRSESAAAALGDEP